MKNEELIRKKNTNEKKIRIKVRVPKENRGKLKNL